MPRRWRLVLFSLSGVLIILLGIAATQLPAIGAGGLLYPVRRRDVGPTPATGQNTTFPGDAVTLKGWQSRGTLVYLHGIADNRSSARE